MVGVGFVVGDDIDIQGSGVTGEGDLVNKSIERGVLS